MLSDDDLLAQQMRLQLEARGVRRDLAIDARFAGVGQITEVGSAALGLMVWRDLDLTVICRDLELPLIGSRAMLVVEHERVWQVSLRDDTGGWRTDPSYPDGIYLGVRYRTPAGDDWNVDIWFVDEPHRQPDLAHLQALPQRLTTVDRRAILRIKQEWAPRPEYGRTVTSYDVYTAVLDDHVRSCDGFEDWLERRNRR